MTDSDHSFQATLELLSYLYTFVKYQLRTAVEDCNPAQGGVTDSMRILLGCAGKLGSAVKCISILLLYVC